MKVIELYQMLGEIKTDLLDPGHRVAGFGTLGTLFGFPAEGWKPWPLCDGTPVLVPGKFNTEPDENGDILMYPDGDPSLPRAPGCPRRVLLRRARPAAADRRRPLDPADNLEIRPIAEAVWCTWLPNRTGWPPDRQGPVAGFGGTSFGDIAPVPGPWLSTPRASATSRSGTSAPSPAATMSGRFSSASARSRWPTWRGCTGPSATG